MGRNSFEAKSQSIERQIRASRSLNPSPLTLLVCFVEDESACFLFCFFDNLAVFPIYPYIFQRACFDIKGPAVSLDGFIVMADDCELNGFQDLIKD